MRTHVRIRDIIFYAYARTHKIIFTYAYVRTHNQKLVSEKNITTTTAVRNVDKKFHQIL